MLNYKRTFTAIFNLIKLVYNAGAYALALLIENFPASPLGNDNRLQAG